MNDAAVLDFTTHRRDLHSSRMLARAAGVALQVLARHPKDFKESLNALESGTASVTVAKWAAPIADATGLAADDIEASLIRQLRQVLKFALLDGGTVEGSLPAITELIESGRVELFAG